MNYEIGKPYLIEYPKNIKLSILIDKNPTDLTFYDGTCFTFSNEFIEQGNIKIYEYNEKNYTEEYSNEFIRLLLEIKKGGE